MDDYEDPRVQRIRAPRLFRRERAEQEGLIPKQDEKKEPPAPPVEEKKDGES